MPDPHTNPHFIHTCCGTWAMKASEEKTRFEDVEIQINRMNPKDSRWNEVDRFCFPERKFEF
jgi:hypothetical protein